MRERHGHRDAEPDPRGVQRERLPRQRADRRPLVPEQEPRVPSTVCRRPELGPASPGSPTRGWRAIPDARHRCDPERLLAAGHGRRRSADTWCARGCSARTFRRRPANLDTKFAVARPRRPASTSAATRDGPARLPQDDGLDRLRVRGLRRLRPAPDHGERLAHRRQRRGQAIRQGRTSTSAGCPGRGSLSAYLARSDDVSRCMMRYWTYFAYGERRGARTHARTTPSARRRRRTASRSRACSWQSFTRRTSRTACKDK